MDPKEWFPKDSRGVKPFVPYLTERLEEMVLEQRELTNYTGADEGWVAHVADQVWDVEAYQSIGYFSGYIVALLQLASVARRFGVLLPEDVETRAGLYVYD